MDEQLNAREQGDIKHNEGAANPGGKIKEPAELKVLGPNATAAEQIDLSYNPEYGDTKTGNTVTLERPFCVQTGGDGFELQLANTTNIKGLTIELYKAENPGPR